MKKRLGEQVKLFVVLSLGILMSLTMGCGGGGTSSSPSTSATSTGAVTADSTGTITTATTVNSPAGLTITLQPGTKLTDSTGAPVTGSIPTTITYSTSANDLPADALAKAPDVDIAVTLTMGSVLKMDPPMVAKISVPGLAPGTLVDIYSLEDKDPNAEWLPEQSEVPVASDGTISISIPHCSIFAISRSGILFIRGIPQTKVTAGTPYVFHPSVFFTKQLNTTLTFNIVNKPVWATFNTATGDLTGTPTTANVGTTTGIVISATYGKLNVNIPSYNLTVVAPTTGSTGTTGTGGF